jgi:hypothetical protein
MMVELTDAQKQAYERISLFLNSDFHSEEKTLLDMIDLIYYILQTGFPLSKTTCRLLQRVRLRLINMVIKKQFIGAFKTFPFLVAYRTIRGETSMFVNSNPISPKSPPQSIA